jgi:hypothetical protein
MVDRVTNFNQKINLVVAKGFSIGQLKEAQEKILAFAEDLAVKNRQDYPKYLSSPEHQDVQEYSRQLDTKLSLVQ